MSDIKLQTTVQNNPRGMHCPGSFIAYGATDVTERSVLFSSSGKYWSRQGIKYTLSIGAMTRLILNSSIIPSSLNLIRSCLHAERAELH